MVCPVRRQLPIASPEWICRDRPSRPICSDAYDPSAVARPQSILSVELVMLPTLRMKAGVFVLALASWSYLFSFFSRKSSHRVTVKANLPSGALPHVKLWVKTFANLKERKTFIEKLLKIEDLRIYLYKTSLAFYAHSEMSLPTAFRAGINQLSPSISHGPEQPQPCTHKVKGYAVN